MDHTYHDADYGCVHVRKLVNGLTTAERERRTLLMLQAFIDDSGRGVDPAFVLAGYVGRVQNWESFSDRWQDILNEKPTIAYLKATEAVWLQGEFRGWYPEDRDKKVLKLIGLIKQHTKYAVDISVATRAYRNVFRGARRPFNKPYAIAFTHLVTWLLGSAAERSTRERLRFIFDIGVLEREAEINEAYAAMMEHLPRSLTDLLDRRPSFQDDKDVKPLQAADLWAWHIRRQLNEIVQDRDAWQTPVWSALSQIPTRTMPPLGEHYLTKYKQRMFDRGWRPS